MEIKKFLGIKNVTSDDRLKPGELASATDIELDNTGKALSRKGYTKVSSTPMRSVYNSGQVTLAAVGDNLKQVNADFSLTQVAALGSATLEVSYETVAGTVYWSNGLVSGRVVGATPSTWGVATPVGQPTATAVPGSLPAGRYLYAITFLRSDGHESGTGVSGQIDLPLGGGIRFDSIEVSTNASVSAKLLYLSGASGEVMFRVATLPNQLGTWAVTTHNGTVPLMTQHAGPPPAGNMVRYFNGSMYVVSGDVAYKSDPYELELFRMEVNYLRFPGQVAMFEPVNDGIFVATVDVPGDTAEAEGDTWYLAGADPAKSVKVFDHGAIPGTAASTDAGFLESPIAGEAEGMQGRLAVMWATRFGICAGFDGGSARNYTDSKYSLPTAQRGAGMVRQDRGFAQYVVALQGVGGANNEYTRG